MEPNLKCHFVKQLSLYAQRILYAYKCDMESLNDDINKVRGFIEIEDNINVCNLRGKVINDLNKYRQFLKDNYSQSCRGC